MQIRCSSSPSSSVQIRCKYGTGMVRVPCRYGASTVQVRCRYGAGTGPVASTTTTVDDDDGVDIVVARVGPHTARPLRKPTAPEESSPHTLWKRTRKKTSPLPRLSMFIHEASKRVPGIATSSRQCRNRNRRGFPEGFEPENGERTEKASPPLLPPPPSLPPSPLSSSVRCRYGADTVLLLPPAATVQVPL